MDISLEKVADRETIRRILQENPLYKILGDDAELWQGINFSSDGRNRFWKNGGDFVPDYRHNILHLIGNQVNVINGFSGIAYQSQEDREESEQYVKTAIENISRYLEENCIMYKTRRIKPGAKILDFDNLSIFHDIVQLRIKLSDLPDVDFTNPKFVEKARSLTQTYVGIQMRYREDGMRPAKTLEP